MVHGGRLGEQSLVGIACGQSDSVANSELQILNHCAAAYVPVWPRMSISQTQYELGVLKRRV